MESTLHIALLALLSITTIGQVTTYDWNSAVPICQNKPADVVFVLDSSSSIWRLDFAKQIRFIQDMVDIFDLSPGKTRIGAVSFSNWAFLDFHLNTYRTKEEVKAAFGRIKQVRGDTNTAAALRYLLHSSFRLEHGARRGVPQIAVVLTDGNSNQPAHTAHQAYKAHQDGIHIFAIGIGRDIQQSELKAIASDPDSRYVFSVRSYDALQSIKQLLAIEACRVTDPPTTPAPPTTTPPPREQACGEASMADIVFAVSPSADIPNTNKALDFLRNVVSGFDLDGDRIRIGVVPRDCETLPELSIEESNNKDAILSRINNLDKSQPTLASSLKYMRTVSFSVHNGARREAKNIGVVIIDDEDAKDITKVMREAAKTKLMKNVELIVISVGKEIQPADLSDIATYPSEHRLFRVSSYDELPEITDRVRQAICPVSSKK